MLFESEKVLMHGDKPVCDITIMSGAIKSINNIYSENIEHMPIAVYSEMFGNLKDDKFLRDDFKEWMQTRTVPDSRPNFDLLENAYNEDAYMRAHLPSLTDGYWFCTKQELENGLKFEDMDPRKQYFPSNISKILFGESGIQVDSYDSVDFTTNGALKKAWFAQSLPNDGGYKYFLLKAESGTNEINESFNEIAASCIADELKLLHAPYSLVQANGEKYVVCENVCSDQRVEMVSLDSLLLKGEFGDAGGSAIAWMEKHGFGDDFKKIIAFCGLVNEVDYHYLNVYVMRNVETLEYLGVAPMIDHGFAFSFGSDFYTHSSLTDNDLLDDLKQYGHLLPKLDVDKIIPKLTSIKEATGLSDDKFNEIIKNLYQRSQILNELQVTKTEDLVENKAELTTNNQTLWDLSDTYDSEDFSR